MPPRSEQDVARGRRSTPSGRWRRRSARPSPSRSAATEPGARTRSRGRTPRFPQVDAVGAGLEVGQTVALRVAGGGEDEGVGALAADQPVGARGLRPAGRRRRRRRAGRRRDGRAGGRPPPGRGRVGPRRGPRRRRGRRRRCRAPARAPLPTIAGGSGSAASPNQTWKMVPPRRGRVPARSRRRSRSPASRRPPSRRGRRGWRRGPASPARRGARRRCRTGRRR